MSVSARLRIYLGDVLNYFTDCQKCYSYINNCLQFEILAYINIKISNKMMKLKPYRGSKSNILSL